MYPNPVGYYQNPVNGNSVSHVNNTPAYGAAFEHNNAGPYQQIVLPNGEALLVDQMYKSVIVHSGPPNGVRKTKRIRTVFTEAHTSKLEHEYARHRYLDQSRRNMIAKALSLAERTVKIWFQNRRMKEKKLLQEKAQLQNSSRNLNVYINHQYHPQNSVVNYSPHQVFVPNQNHCPPPPPPPSYAEATADYTPVLPQAPNPIVQNWNNPPEVNGSDNNVTFELGNANEVTQHYSTIEDSFYASMANISI
jgi:hypothetical protein